MLTQHLTPPRRAADPCLPATSSCSLPAHYRRHPPYRAITPARAHGSPDKPPHIPHYSARRAACDCTICRAALPTLVRRLLCHFFPFCFSPSHPQLVLPGLRWRLPGVCWFVDRTPIAAAATPQPAIRRTAATCVHTVSSSPAVLGRSKRANSTTWRLTDGGARAYRDRTLDAIVTIYSLYRVTFGINIPHHLFMLHACFLAVSLATKYSKRQQLQHSVTAGTAGVYHFLLSPSLQQTYLFS